MAITKTFLGYHKGCGGKVYRENSTSSLMSHSFCKNCSSDTARGNLSVENDIEADISDIARSLTSTGDLIGTDNEYVNAYADLRTAIVNSAFGTALLSAYSGTNMFREIEYIDTQLNGVKSSYDSLLSETELLNDKLATAGEAIANTDGTVAPPDPTNLISTYYYTADQKYDNLVDSSSGVLDYTTVNGYTVVRTTADTSADTVIISSDFTTPHAINDIYLVARRIDIDSTVNDIAWVRGTGVKIELSVNGGTGYTSSKFIDSTISGDTTSHVALVHFDTAGSVFKWKFTFVKENYTQNLYSIFALLRYVTGDALTTYNYTKYV